jgi:hypothetical protein
MVGFGVEKFQPARVAGIRSMRLFAAILRLGLPGAA